MKEIVGFFAQDVTIAGLKLKAGELVKINGRVYRYSTVKNDEAHILEPVENELQS
jgi:hypothetical protein